MRTRDEQVNDLVEALWDGMCRKDAEKSAAMIIDEAMELGAAEQRRKDAEGQQVVYQIKLRKGNGSWQDVDLENYQEFSEDTWLRRILYTRPANVAALEVEIAELRGSIEAACSRLSADPYQNCADTHCERKQDCRSPTDCGGTG